MQPIFLLISIFFFKLLFSIFSSLKLSQLKIEFQEKWKLIKTMKSKCSWHSNFKWYSNYQGLNYYIYRHWNLQMTFGTVLMYLKINSNSYVFIQFWFKPFFQCKAPFTHAFLSLFHTLIYALHLQNMRIFFQ